MSFKPTLTKIAGLTLLLSSGLNAAPLFETASSSESFKAEAQVNQLAATKPSVENAYVYNVNAKALSASTNQLELNLVPGLTVFANKESSSKSASGGIIWNGSIASANSAAKGLSKTVSTATDSAMLINRDGKITGTVRTDGRLFTIRPMANGLHMVTELNENNMKADHPPGAMAELEQQLTERLANNTALTQQLQAQPQADANLLADPVIRVMVLYTNGVPAEVNDIPGLIDLAFAETNQGYTNSDVAATVELAHLGSINYNSSSISTDLSRLKSTTDGHMDTVHALRDTHDADVVMLIVPDSGNACGQAGAIGASASTAFAVTAQDCATGYYSFGHELGHLQSARHNPETDGTTTPYAYGHGYRDPGNTWRSVMAYNCTTGCTRINWWSNPDKYRNGTAMGTNSVSDNSRVLTNTAATVAGFRNGSTGGTGGSISESNLSQSRSNWLRYSANVPAGRSSLAVTISGGSGDADLYVNKGSAPSTGSSTYDCRPYKSGNDETCTFSNPGADTWHIGIRAYSTFSGVSLNATW